MIAPARTALVSFLILLISTTALSQLDTGFGTGGVATADLAGDDRPIGGFVLPDGKILAVVEGFSIRTFYNLLRFNSDGTPDLTYGQQGRVNITEQLFTVNPSVTYGLSRAVRQPDGKIIVVGKYGANGLVARLSEDGMLDPGFATGGIHRPNIDQTGDDVVYDVVVQPDGKIVIAGTVPGPGMSRLFLLRYNSEGTLDATFGTEGYIVHNISQRPYQLFLQPNGKIITAEASAYYVGVPPGQTIRRFNTDGTLDSSFSTITFTNPLRITTVQPDGKIVTAEAINQTDVLERANKDVRVARYSVDGILETGFGINGFTVIDPSSRHFDDEPNAITVGPDGQIHVSVATIIQPNRTQLRGPATAIVRLSASGMLMGKFVETKSFFTGDAFLSIYPDGKVLTYFRGFNNQGDVALLLVRASQVPLVIHKYRGVLFDFAGPGGANSLADPVIFRPSEASWYFFPVSTGLQFGLAGDILASSDFIRDTGAEPAVFRPSEGKWYIARTHFDPNNFITVRWGLNGDVPAPADLDGDGKSDITVFRPSNGVWYTTKSSDGSYLFTSWGTDGDKPVPADYDGDGVDDIAVFRPADGNWYILPSSDGQPVYVHFGSNGDIPVQEDYDGDGKADISVWRPSTGVWYRLNSSDGSFAAIAWGISTDIPTPADFDGDSKCDLAVYRPSNGRWYIFQSRTSTWNVVSWGLSTDIPTLARY